MKRHYNKGFSYVEVMVAALIVVAALIPAIDALSGGLRATQAHVTLSEEQFHIASRLEEILALPLGALDVEAITTGDPSVATAYSDAAGSVRRRLVFLSRYDGDDADSDGDRFTGGDEGLIWVRIELENTNTAIETLTGW